MRHAGDGFQTKCSTAAIYQCIVAACAAISPGLAADGGSRPGTACHGRRRRQPHHSPAAPACQAPDSPPLFFAGYILCCCCCCLSGDIVVACCRVSEAEGSWASNAMDVVGGVVRELQVRAGSDTGAENAHCCGCLYVRFVCVCLS